MLFRSTPSGPSDKKGVDAPPAKQPSSMWKWLRRAGLGGVGVGIALTARTKNGGDTMVDFPMPPGGGGAGGGGGGVYPPVPVDLRSASMADDPAAQEAAIQQALDRIRGARSGGTRRATQTLLNY